MDDVRGFLLSKLDMKISYAKAKRQVEDVDEEGALRCAFSPFLVLRVNHTEATQLLFLALVGNKGNSVLESHFLKGFGHYMCLLAMFVCLLVFFWRGAASGYRETR